MSCFQWWTNVLIILFRYQFEEFAFGHQRHPPIVSFILDEEQNEAEEQDESEEQNEAEEQDDTLFVVIL